MSRPPDLPWRKPYAHPGCKVMLAKCYSTYDTGLCRTHGGRATGKSQVAPVAQPYAPPERPGVRVVEVTAFARGNGSTSGERQRVSLAREPWLSIGDLAGRLVEKASRHE